ncbi:MAG: CBS domain-containing protein [Flavobacteriaceae bacterium]|nr:CBS domain-containing protein [Flavobacteriaceae bacterium]
MKQRVPVSQIMTKELVTLTTKDSLNDAEKLFKEYKVRHLPVVSGKELIGILSHSDLLRISFAELSDDEEKVDATVFNMYSIEQVMAKNPVSVSPEKTIREVTEILSQQSFHSLPVVENGELKGMITTTDLLNYFLDQY